MESSKLKYFSIFVFSSILTLSLLPVRAIADSNPLPDLGSPDLIVYDQATEEEFGRAFTAALYADYNIYQDLDTQHYIRQLGHRLASYTGSDRDFSFHVIDDASINAFAGPNGVIGIHTGLIHASESEDELAAVIAHEISHVTQNHLSRRYEYASSYGNINSVATFIAAVLIGMHDANAGMATLMGGMGYNLQQQLKNSRLHESEADAIGINLLHKAGFDPHAMGDFFGRLSKASSLDTFHVPEILRTHPVSDNRLAEAENRANQLEKLKTTIHKDDFKLVKLKVAKHFNASPAEINLLANDKPELRCFKNALIKPGTLDADCGKTLISKTEASPIYMSQYLANLPTTPQNHTTQEYKTITNQFTYFIDLFPNNPALMINYSHYLDRHDMTNEAIQILEKHIGKLSYTYEANKTLSELHNKLNNQAAAYYYLAQAVLEIGNPERAKYLIEQADEIVKPNNKKLRQKIKLFIEENHNLLKNKDKTT